jgi:tetratricopeptide (TPR) repeat protein
MENLINQINKILAVLMCSFSCFSFAQPDANTEKQVRLVFNQLISVYGSAKPQPKLEFVEKGKFPVQPARYSPKPIPKIEIDVALYKLCQSFDKDSLNALAVVLSHELTHYYNDHTFCSDYAFANFKANAELQKKISQASYNARIEKESEADIKGFFYAAAAGFKPHGLQGLLIEKIYTAYKLSDIQKGYPTKKERIDIANKAEKTATQLYEHFKNGLIALENKQYEQAIEYFNKANSQVPFRENWNNIGVAYARKALALKVPSKSEYDNPKRFLYPLEVENKSRLQNETTRSIDDTSELIESLLYEAQKAFDKALQLDPSFHKSRISLACVFDLLSKHNSAIAEITEKLPKEVQETTEAKRILAIAYWNADLEVKAEKIWKELKM